MLSTKQITEKLITHARGKYMAFKGPFQLKPFYNSMILYLDGKIEIIFYFPLLLYFLLFFFLTCKNELER